MHQARPKSVWKMMHLGLRQRETIRLKVSLEPVMHLYLEAKPLMGISLSDFPIDWTREKKANGSFAERFANGMEQGKRAQWGFC